MKAPRRSVLGLMRGKRGGDAAIRFVVCVDNSGYEASLKLQQIYALLPDPDAAKDGDLRIVDESSESYLYEADRFVLFDLHKVFTRGARRKKASAETR